MTAAYATAEQVGAWLPTHMRVEGTDELDRLAMRASRLLDAKVRQPFLTDADGLPTDPTIAEALMGACCAQVDYWLRGPGEEHDLEGMAGRQVSIGQLSMSATLDEVAPEAARILVAAGLTAVPNGPLPLGNFTPGVCW